nr:serine/threonine-protein kinase Nek5-like [Leptinotarsa decemlineata]
MRNSVSKDLPNFSQIMTEKIKMMEFYNTVRQLGKGTFGTVQLCERIHNKQKIVVKQIVTELEGQQLEAAKNEVVILKSLNHPNVIQYYDSYIQKGLFYIVMEYASKGTLQESIERERPKYFTPQVSNIVLSIANGRKKTVNTKVYGKQMQEIIDMMLQPRPEDRPDTLALMTHPDIFPSLYYLGSYLGCIE